MFVVHLGTGGSEPCSASVIYNHHDPLHQLGGRGCPVVSGNQSAVVDVV